MLKNCEETNSKGSCRTGIARLKEEVERKKEEKESEKNSRKSGFSTVMEWLLGKGLEHSVGSSIALQSVKEKSAKPVIRP